MKFTDIPAIDRLRSAGAKSDIFDILLLVGPFMVLLLALCGRNRGTTALAAGYLLVFVAAVAYAAVDSPR